MKGRRSWGIVIMMTVILSMGSLSHAQGAEWILFATTDKGMHYYDRQTMKRSKTNVRVWEKTIYSEEGKRRAEQFLTDIGEFGGEVLDHVVTLTELNCQEEKGRGLSMVIYDIKGNRVAGSPKGDSEWSAIVPDSLYDRLFKQVCK